jgi:hypothetical protein
MTSWEYIQRVAMMLTKRLVKDGKCCPDLCIVKSALHPATYVYVNQFMFNEYYHYLNRLVTTYFSKDVELKSRVSREFNAVAWEYDYAINAVYEYTDIIGVRKCYVMQDWKYLKRRCMIGDNIMGGIYGHNRGTDVLTHLIYQRIDTRDMICKQRYWLA